MPFFLSKNAPHVFKLSLEDHCGIKRTAGNVKYPGTPLFLKRKRSDNFNHILGSLARRTKGWQNKLLSKVGKSSSIRTVLKSIPIYQMSTFVFSKRLCQKMDCKKCPLMKWNDIRLLSFQKIEDKKLLFQNGVGLY